jgi:hypothetical protein
MTSTADINIYTDLNAAGEDNNPPIDPSNVAMKICIKYLHKKDTYEFFQGASHPFNEIENIMPEDHKGYKQRKP